MRRDGQQGCQPAARFEPRWAWAASGVEAGFHGGVEGTDGQGGVTAQGVRWWLTYHVHGVHLPPIPRRHVSSGELDEEEERLEDYAVWIATTRPSGVQCSAETIKKYVSSVRAFLFRVLKRVFGRGAAASIIPDLLMGYARAVDQPPKLERDGCTPAALRAGMDELGVSTMWRAALEFGEVALARGCEFALDASRREVFQVSEHMVPARRRHYLREWRPAACARAYVEA